MSLRPTIKTNTAPSAAGTLHGPAVTGYRCPGAGRRIAPWVLMAERDALFDTLSLLKGRSGARNMPECQRFENLMAGCRAGKNDLEVFAIIEQFHTSTLAIFGIYPDPTTAKVSPQDVIDYVKKWTFAMKVLIDYKNGVYGIAQNDFNRLLDVLPPSVTEAEKVELARLFSPRANPARFVSGTELFDSLKTFETRHLKPLKISSEELRFDSKFGPQQLAQLFAYWLSALG